MANHAYHYSADVPSDPDVVDRDVRELVASDFPMFQVQHEGTWWLIALPDETCDGVQFWLDGPQDDPEGYGWDGCGKGWYYLNFRHSHHGLFSQFYWWLEWRITSYFVSKYGCLSNDNGIGNYEHDSYEKSPKTFGERAARLVSGGGPRSFFTWMEWHDTRRHAPKELQPLIGECPCSFLMLLRMQAKRLWMSWRAWRWNRKLRKGGMR